MFETLFNLIPWGSIIMEGVNGLCEIVDDFFGNRSNNNRCNNNNYGYSESVRVQPQYNNPNYGYNNMGYSNNNNYYNQPMMGGYNEEGKRMIQGVYFID